MEDIITGRFETGDEARAAAASLADSVNENDIFILFDNQPSALDSDRDAVRTNDQGGAKGTATVPDSRGIAAGIATTVIEGPAGAAVATLAVMPTYSQQVDYRGKAKVRTKPHMSRMA
jgi:hypothetical protein